MTSKKRKKKVSADLASSVLDVGGMSEIRKSLATRFRKARQTARLTQAQAGARFNVSERQIQKWEAGNIPIVGGNAHTIMEFIKAAQ